MRADQKTVMNDKLKVGPDGGVMKPCLMVSAEGHGDWRTNGGHQVPGRFESVVTGRAIMAAYSGMYISKNFYVPIEGTPPPPAAARAHAHVRLCTLAGQEIRPSFLPGVCDER